MELGLPKPRPLGMSSSISTWYWPGAPQAGMEPGLPKPRPPLECRVPSRHGTGRAHRRPRWNPAFQKPRPLGVSSSISTWYWPGTPQAGMNPGLPKTSPPWSVEFHLDMVLAGNSAGRDGTRPSKNLGPPWNVEFHLDMVLAGRTAGRDETRPSKNLGPKEPRDYLTYPAQLPSRYQPAGWRVCRLRARRRYWRCPAMPGDRRPGRSPPGGTGRRRGRSSSWGFPYVR